MVELFKNNDKYHSFLRHNSTGAVAVTPVELMQPVQFTSCYKSVILFKANEFQFQYYCNSKIKYYLLILFLICMQLTKTTEL